MKGAKTGFGTFALQALASRCLDLVVGSIKSLCPHLFGYVSPLLVQDTEYIAKKLEQEVTSG